MDERLTVDMIRKAVNKLRDAQQKPIKINDKAYFVWKVSK